jgi:hypothetical protein
MLIFTKIIRGEPFSPWGAILSLTCRARDRCSRPGKPYSMLAMVARRRRWDSTPSPCWRACCRRALGQVFELAAIHPEDLLAGWAPW